jgi:branched-chain amino acid transport system permease protein
LDQLLQHLLNGLLLGATYSLLGIGLTLVFGLMNVVNFAHGEFYTLGAYAAFAALALAPVPFFLAIPLAIAAGALAGAVCERVLLRPLRGQSIDTVMLVMIGLWIAMQNAELLGWGGVAKSVPTPFPTEPVVLGAVSVAPLRIFVFVVSGLLILGAHLLLSRTKLGRAMRATFQDRETAALMGVSIERIHTVAEPGDRIRTRITSADQSLDFEVALSDPRAAVKRVRIAYEVPGANGRTEEVEFTLESEDLPDE